MSKKDTIINEPQSPDEFIVLDKFFNQHPSLNPTIIAAQDFLKNLDAKHPYKDEFIKRIGIPYWNKSLVYTNVRNNNSGILTESAENPATVVYIPFVRDSQYKVNASVIIKMTATDTLYRILCDWQYRDFDFEGSDTSWSVRDIFNIFATLEKSVFGYTKYRVKDGRVFGYSQETQLIVSETPTVQGRMATEGYSLECKTRTVCITAGPSTNSTGMVTETVCKDYTTCSLVWTGGGPGPIPDPGGGGGPGGSGGPAGPTLPANSCPVLPRGGYTTEVANLNPCDSTIWTPEPPQVINLLEDPCKKAALNAITSSAINNLITNWYNTFLIPSNTLTIAFIENDIAGPAHSVPIVDPNYWQVTLSNNLVYGNNAMSQEAWGAIIAHEILHIFITTTGINSLVPQNNYSQHAFIFSHFINTTRDLLHITYGMPLPDATRLALNGLGDLWAFGNFEALSAQLYGANLSQIQSTYLHYTAGYGGTRCN